MDSIFKQLANTPVPNQARSKAALERFLNAGEHMLAENRFEEAGIATLASEAESSVGSFYRLFADKESLLMLLLKRFFLHIEESCNTDLAPEKWQGKGISEIADGCIKSLVLSYQGHSGTLRALVLRSSRDIEFRQQVHLLNKFYNDKLGVLLRERADEITHPTPNRAIKSVGHIILGILNQHTMTGNLDGLSEKMLIEEVKRIFLSYLGVKG